MKIVFNICVFSCSKRIGLMIVGLSVGGIAFFIARGFKYFRLKRGVGGFTS